LLCTCLSSLLLIAAGCSGICVRKGHMGDVFQAWRASMSSGGNLSPRTAQTLRRWDLEKLYGKEPDEAIARLHSVAVHDPQPELLFALAETCYLRGKYAERWSCHDAVGHYYLCAGYAWHYLFATCTHPPSPSPAVVAVTTQLSPVDAFDPRFRLACEFYNTGVAKCIAAAQKADRLDPRQVLHVPGASGQDITLSVVHAGFTWDPEEFGPLLFCDDYEIRGLANQYRTYGLGVPLIATRSPDVAPRRYFPKAVSFPVTAFFRFEGTLADLGARRAGRLELYNPMVVQAVEVRGRSVPLETDLTTPLAHFLANTDLDRSFTGFLRPDRLKGDSGIYMLEPYQPGKIPVLMVHGLLSSPLTWAPLFNDLRADPTLMKRYQFWFYSYPTADPYLATAADLRRDLDRLRRDLDPEGKDRALDDLVLVGHSMGGLVSRLMTVQSGDDFWKLISPVSFDRLRLKPESRSELSRIFFFDPQPAVKRVVFLGTPHRGSRLSPAFAGRLAVKLMALPQTLVDAAQDLADDNPDAVPGMKPGQLPTSVDLLAPESPALVLLAARARPEAVHYHSIIGVAPPNEAVVEKVLSGTTCEPSDGVVPYRSAHLEGVDSEVVVPASHHEVHHHPLAILEVRRILLEHLRQNTPTIVPLGVR
jgi:pimeloyl-ACP methyl ester carboxylesterase